MQMTVEQIAAIAVFTIAGMYGVWSFCHSISLYDEEITEAQRKGLIAALFFLLGLILIK